MTSHTGSPRSRWPSAKRRVPVQIRPARRSSYTWSPSTTTSATRRPAPRARTGSARRRGRRRARPASGTRRDARLADHLAATHDAMAHHARADVEQGRTLDDGVVQVEERDRGRPSQRLGRTCGAGTSPGARRRRTGAGSGTRPPSIAATSKPRVQSPRKRVRTSTSVPGARLEEMTIPPMTAMCSPGPMFGDDARRDIAATGATHSVVLAHHC